MRHPLGAREREEIEQALRDINRIIRLEYPEPPPLPPGPDDAFGVDPEVAFQWGVGDGFMMALRGVVDAALPGWRTP